MSVKGKVVLITGAASGIGRALAICFHNDDANVAGLDIDGTGLEQTARACGNSMVTVQGDVTSEVDIDRLVAATIERFGRIDILINNAGINDGGSLMYSVPFENWKNVIEINLIGVALCTHRVLPGMLERGYGRIVNVVSRAAQSVSTRGSAYAASKAAVVSFTKNIANTIERETHPDVLVNGIIPGITRTAIWSKIFESDLMTEERRAMFQEPEAVYPHTRFIVDLPSGGPTGRCFFYGEDYSIFSRFNL